MTTNVAEIKTYSGKTPLTKFSSQIQFVHKPVKRNVGNENTNSPSATIQEGDITVEKTLEIHFLEDTFDRLANGIIYPERPTDDDICFNGSSSEEGDSAETSVDLFATLPVSTARVSHQEEPVGITPPITPPCSVDTTDEEFKKPKTPVKANQNNGATKIEVKGDFEGPVTRGKRKRKIDEDDFVHRRKRHAAEWEILENLNSEGQREKIRVSDLKSCYVHIENCDDIAKKLCKSYAPTQPFHNVPSSTPITRRSAVSILRHKALLDPVSPISAIYDDFNDSESDEEPDTIINRSIRKYCRPIYDVRIVLEKLDIQNNLPKDCSVSNDYIESSVPDSVQKKLELIALEKIGLDNKCIHVSNSELPISYSTPKVNDACDNNLPFYKEESNKTLTVTAHKESNILTDLSNYIQNSPAIAQASRAESSYCPDDWTNDYNTTCKDFLDNRSDSDKENETNTQLSEKVAAEDQSSKEITFGSTIHYLEETKKLENQSNNISQNIEYNKSTNISYLEDDITKTRNIEITNSAVLQDIGEFCGKDKNEEILMCEEKNISDDSRAMEIHKQMEVSECNNKEKGKGFETSHLTDCSRVEEKVDRNSSISAREKDNNVEMEVSECSNRDEVVEEGKDQEKSKKLENLQDTDYSNVEENVNKNNSISAREMESNEQMEVSGCSNKEEATEQTKYEKKSQEFSNSQDIDHSKVEENVDENDKILSSQNITDIVDEIEKSLNGEQDLSEKDIQLLLSRLKDPINVTMNRNRYQKWKKPDLDTINESFHITNESGMVGKDKSFANSLENRNNNDIDIDEVNISHALSIIQQSVAEKNLDEVEEKNQVNDDASCQIERKVFLKPGKSWARSLSIINNFYNNQNFDKMAIGRGKNWRHSIQNILNMQPEGGNTKEEEKVSEKQEKLVTTPKTGDVNEKRVTVFTTSPCRPSRHFSIRFVPTDPDSRISNYFDESLNADKISKNTRKTSLARRKHSHSLSRNSIATEDDVIKSAKDIILKRCCQTSYLPFKVVFPNSYLDQCKKIGEGVYGEVFLYENGSQKTVIKIIPIEGEKLVNCEPQKKFHEILSEIVIAEELHKLREGEVHSTGGFVGVQKIKCIVGKYPKKLIKLWKQYDQEKESENDCPSMFDENQLYVALELNHGGQDLETYMFKNASESYSIFLQTAVTLAVAEKSLEFEHRDLHWGNILISDTKDVNMRYKLDSKEIKLPTKGVTVSVIDFTLSRMSFRGCNIFNDLSSDPTLFTAQGEYQFDVYRKMRDLVDNDWQKFNPHTNVLWLDYALDKILNAVKYRRKKTKIHSTSIEQMQEIKKEILNYSSAFEFITKCKKLSGVDGI